jgi:ABC-2 type transport system ATP-binding protein
VCGYSIYNGAKDIRRMIGYMPDFFGVYDDMKVIEYLEFFAAAYRIKGAERRTKCDQVLDLVDLGYKRDALVTSLSRGMTQRLGLARVLLHEPQVLLLDEPASGLDPRARIEMRGLLKELRKMGKTILVSSHILPELADICNKIGIIERGKLLFDGDVNDAIRQVQQRVVFDVKVPPEQLAQAEDLLAKHPGVDKVERKEPEEFDEIRKRDADEFLKVTLKDGVFDGSFIAQVLVQNGVGLKMLKEEEIDLEDVFMGITKGITN